MGFQYGHIENGLYFLSFLSVGHFCGKGCDENNDWLEGFDEIKFERYLRKQMCQIQRYTIISEFLSEDNEGVNTNYFGYRNTLARLFSRLCSQSINFDHELYRTS